MDIQAGDIWEEANGNRYRIVCAENYHVWIQWLRDGDYDSLHFNSIIDEADVLIERDGKLVEPAKQGPKVERFEIVRGDPSSTPYVHIDGEPYSLAGLWNDERIHGYIYPETKDHSEHVSALPFQFYDGKGDCGYYDFCEVEHVRVLPVAVLVEV